MKMIKMMYVEFVLKMYFVFVVLLNNFDIEFPK